MTRCVHYVGFRGDEFARARRVFGGPVIIHRRWDKRARREIGGDDLVVFANKESKDYVHLRNAPDIIEKEPDE